MFYFLDDKLFDKDDSQKVLDFFSSDTGESSEPQLSNSDTQKDEVSSILGREDGDTESYRIISAYATGRRKSCVARVFVDKSQSEHFFVNRIPMQEYFLGMEVLIKKALEPVLFLGIDPSTISVKSTVRGSGLSSQSQALSYGLSKALAQCDEKARLVLKKSGFLKYDSRVVERKKYGLKKARKSFQFSKR